MATPFSRPLARLLGRDAQVQAADRAYLTIVDRARMPVFYADHGVPDTLDGRFELIALHSFLVMRRLKTWPDGQALGQAIFDLMFDDMDRALREMGAGDLGVGPRIRNMAKAFYGRIAAYDAGLAGSGDMSDALQRNLFGTVERASPDDVQWFARYLARQSQALGAADEASLAEGMVAFAAIDE